MNFDWIFHPLAMYGSVLVCLYVVLSTRLELSERRKRALAERKELSEEFQKLAAKLASLESGMAELAERPAAAAPVLPAVPRAMNLNQRAEALRMYRRGHQTHTIAAALGLPTAEVSLLQTVQAMLEKEERQN